MAGFNPCCCWNLKDGCVTIGIWTLAFSLFTLAVFSWQTAVINDCRYTLTTRNTFYCPDYCPCRTYVRYHGGEHVLVGLFVVQILNLIAAFFLLFASVALIYGIHTSSKYLVWPWFPCIVAGIICSLAYCVMWWVGDVSGYWLVLTVVEVVSVLINIYCLLCVIVQYRRIVRGYQAPSEDDSVKEQRLVGYDYPYRPTDTGMFTYGPEKKVGEGVWNVMYEPDTRVHMYGKDTQGRPIVAPSELVAYSTEPAGAAEQPTQPEREQEFPCSKSEMTEEWLKNVMSSHPEEPKEQPASPVKEKTYSRSRSVDALQKETRGRSRRSMRSAKSKESMSRRAADSSVCSTCTVSSVEGRSRSEGRHRAKAASDSEDTGYSRSAIDSYADQQKKKKHRHHRHRHGHEHGDREHRSRRHRKRGEDGDEENKGKKRLRDVKREDKERRVQQQQEDQASIPVVRPETSSSATGPPAGAVPVFPFGAGRGAISIPQHIVIPPQPKGAPNQPQRFHINSEITISYSDRSAPGSDSEHRPPSSGAPIGPQQATQAGLTTPPVPPPRNTADSNKSNTSAESKGYGSTAV